MRWYKLLILSVEAALFLAPLIGLIACQIQTPIVPTPIQKGASLPDPIFNGGDGIQLITGLNNLYDANLAKTPVERPKDLTSYSLIESEELKKDKAKFLIQPMSTTAISFSWTKTNNKFVAVAIFCNPIKIKNSEIDNKEDMVWFWTSNSGDPGKVTYGTGYKPTYLDNKFSLEKPISLTVNKLYVWCVWTWDDEGRTISASSRELPILIKP